MTLSRVSRVCATPFVKGESWLGICGMSLGWLVVERACFAVWRLFSKSSFRDSIFLYSPPPPFPPASPASPFSLTAFSNASRLSKIARAANRCTSRLRCTASRALSCSHLRRWISTSVTAILLVRRAILEDCSSAWLFTFTEGVGLARGWESCAMRADTWAAIWSGVRGGRGLGFGLRWGGLLVFGVEFWGWFGHVRGG